MTPFARLKITSLFLIVLALATGCTTTALHRAARKGSLDGVESALLKGISPNARDGKGNTPLHYAAGRGLKEALPALLDSKRSTLEQTEAIFKLAESVDDLMILDLLLRNGADVNSANDYGQTPLHMAALNNSPAAALMLLAQGANPEVKDKLGRTPLELAMQHGYRDLIEMLKKGELERINRGPAPPPGAGGMPAAPPKSGSQAPTTPLPR